jgi:HD-GYP domain-containing protein (c-di-GMP phosphodiesterase class II)
LSWGVVVDVLSRKFSAFDIILIGEEDPQARALVESDMQVIAHYFYPQQMRELAEVLNREFQDPGELDLRPVFVVDLRPDDCLNFDVYLFLPANRRYIKFIGKGTRIEQRRLDRLKEAGWSRVFVEEAAMKEFYDYTSRRLTEIYGSESGKLSATERNRLLAATVRDLMGVLYNNSQEASYERGKDMMACCQGIVSNFITNGRKEEWYDRIFEAIGGESGNFQGAASASTLSALFAIGLGMERPEELAFAGLFADVGLSLLPAELAVKDTWDVRDDEKVLYYTHSEKTIEYLKDRKIRLSANVIRAIREHHEDFSGNGWPSRLKGDQISREGELLGFTLRFIELTRVVPGRSNCSPVMAIQQIEQSQAVSPNFIERIKEIFGIPFSES